jgi:short-subunit dehydrogenase
MKVQSKVIIVTGAGGGIGGELVRELLKKGANVAAVDLRDESLNKLKDSINELPGKLTMHALNISDRKAVENLPESVVAEQGRVDGLINCAGIIQPFVKVNDLDYDAIERVMNVNFYGTLYMTKAFLPYFLKRDEAHIVNVSSMGGFLPVPGQSIYGASKAAVKLMSEGLYAELLNTPVRVSLVFPGATNTDITKNSDVGSKTPSTTKDDVKKMNIKMLSPEKAAKIIIDGMEKNKPQIFTGSDSRFMNILYRLNPVYATKLITKQMQSLLK